MLHRGQQRRLRIGLLLVSIPAATRIVAIAAVRLLPCSACPILITSTSNSSKSEGSSTTFSTAFASCYHTEASRSRSAAGGQQPSAQGQSRTSKLVLLVKPLLCKRLYNFDHVLCLRRPIDWPIFPRDKFLNRRHVWLPGCQLSAGPDNPFQV